jgi:hypothetical protein
MKTESEINTEITMLKKEIGRAVALIDDDSISPLECDMHNRTRNYLQDRVNALNWVLKTDEVK